MQIHLKPNVSKALTLKIVAMNQGRYREDTCEASFEAAENYGIFICNMFVSNQVTEPFVKN